MRVKSYGGVLEDSAHKAYLTEVIGIMADNIIYIATEHFSFRSIVKRVSMFVVK